jgi:hypothetical protein
MGIEANRLEATFPAKPSDLTLRVMPRGLLDGGEGVRE